MRLFMFVAPWLQIPVLVVLLVVLYLLRRSAEAKLLTTLGCALLAIVGRRTEIDARLVKFPDYVYVVLLIGGVALAVVGIIGLIVPFNKVIVRAKEFIANIFEKRFICRAAATEELEQALVFSQSFFGEGATTDIDSVRELHSKNPKLFYLVYELSGRRGKTTTKLVGFFDLVPVTKSAASLLEREKLDGPSLTAQHIVKSNGRASAIYLAGFGAGPVVARAWILGKLEDRIGRYREKGLPIYTRPVTERGLQLAKQHNFSAVDPSAGDNELLRIYKLNPSTESFEKRKLRQSTRRRLTRRKNVV